VTKSYLVKLLIVISNQATKTEVHSETACVLFDDVEMVYLNIYGMHHHEDDSNIAHSLRNATSLMAQFSNPGTAIFRTNNQRKKLDEVFAKIKPYRDHIVDAVVLEKITGTTEELTKILNTFKKDPANVLWQGEFN
jgi:hypothetical protein